MLNILWAGMIMVGVLYGAIHGTMREITEAAIQSAGEGISLCITMAGLMAFWVGLMEIAEKAGLVKKLSKMLSPFIQFLFPDIPQDHRARDFISTNIIANILGLGWASTPAGLKAMECLTDLKKERGEDGEKASDEMCNFLILNISSLQLIPVSMIAYRQQYGSINPTAIIGPGIVATLISTGVGVFYCKLKMKPIKKQRIKRIHYERG